MAVLNILFFSGNRKLLKQVNEMTFSMRVKCDTCSVYGELSCRLKIKDYDLVFIDSEDFVGFAGQSKIKQLKTENRTLKLVVMVSYGGMSSAVDAVEAGLVNAYVLKPLEKKALDLVLAEAAHCNVPAGNGEAAVNEFVPESGAMQELEAKYPGITMGKWRGRDRESWQQ